MPPNLANKAGKLVWNVPIVNRDGTPTNEFMLKWLAQSAVNGLIPADIQTPEQMSAILDLLGDTPGSVLYRGTSEWEILTPGTDGYFLQTHAGIGPPTWEDVPIPPPPDIQDLLDTISTTRGTVLYRGAATWDALAPGTAGFVLQTGGAGADPSWVAQTGGGGSGDVVSTIIGSTMTTSTSSFATKGSTFAPAFNCTIKSVLCDVISGAVGNVIQAAIFPTNAAGTSITGVALGSATVAKGVSGDELLTFTFSSPVALTAGGLYVILITNTSSTTTTVLSVPATTALVRPNFAALGGTPVLSTNARLGGTVTVASIAPASGDTLTFTVGQGIIITLIGTVP